MTSPAPLDGPHLDLDALADLLAGEGSDEQVRHLERCAACAGELAELDDASAPVTAALGALPQPAPPPGLEDRLTTALAAAGPVDPAPQVVSGAGSVEREDASPPAPAPVRSSTVTPMRPRPKAPWLPAAAAAVLLLSAGGLVLALAGRGGDESDTAATATAPQAESGMAAADALAGTAFNASGRDYAQPGALDTALPQVLAGQGVAASPPEGATPDQAVPDPATAARSTPGLERLREPAALADCLSALLPPEDPGARPLALDYATYGGAPALLVVLPATDPAKVDAFVVGPDCSAANDATLFFTRLDRPA